MTANEIIKAMQDAKVYEAAKLQAATANWDNLSLLTAVATGKALLQFELYEIYTALTAE